MQNSTPKSPKLFEYAARKIVPYFNMVKQLCKFKLFYIDIKKNAYFTNSNLINILGLY